MKELWQTAVIFISSTFRDMQQERDLIKRILVPELNEYFMRYKVCVRLIDMRWGINTEKIDEGEREHYILDVCLNEIDRSRPFFLGLLGHRYGWVPSVKQMGRYNRRFQLQHPISVTELEIRYGVFMNSPARSIFCFRESIENLPEDERPIYIEGTPERLQAIKSLRDSIRSKLDQTNNLSSIIEYDSEWNGSCAEPEKGFIEHLKKVLIEKISIEFGIDKQSATKFINKYRTLETAIGTHRINIGKNTIVRDVIPTGMFTASSKVRIDGAPRNGKSVLLAQTAMILEERTDILPIYYSSLVDTECRNPMTMLNYFGYAVSKALGEEWEEVFSDYYDETLIFGTRVQVNNSYPVLEKRITNLCNRIASRGILPVFLIDSYDSLIGEYYSHTLPLRDCDTVSIVFVCSDDRGIGSTDVFQCSNYSEEDVDAIITASLDMESKDIHASVRRVLKEKSMLVNGTYAVGWIAMALYWLMNLNADDFAAINRHVASGDEQKIEQYFIELVSSMPSDEAALFQQFAMKNGSVFGTKLVEHTIVALSFSPFGMSEREMAALAGPYWDELAFARFRRWFTPFISESPGLRSWQMRSESIRETLKRQLMPSARQFHIQMIDILESLPLNDPVRRRDLPYHLLATSDYSKCASMIISAKYFMVEDFARSMALFSEEERIKSGYGIIEVCPFDHRPEVLAFIIIMLYLRNNMIGIEKIIEFAINMVQQMPAKNYAGDEYSLTCLSEIWSELSLLAKYHGTIDQQQIIAEALIDVGRTKYRHFKSFDSKQSLYKGIMALSSFYMECGEFNRSLELCSELTDLCDSDY